MIGSRRARTALTWRRSWRSPSSSSSSSLRSCRVGMSSAVTVEEDDKSGGVVLWLDEEELVKGSVILFFLQSLLLALRRRLLPPPTPSEAMPVIMSILPTRPLPFPSSYTLVLLPTVDDELFVVIVNDDAVDNNNDGDGDVEVDVNPLFTSPPPITFFIVFDGAACSFDTIFTIAILPPPCCCCCSSLSLAPHTRAVGPSLTCLTKQ